MSLSYELELEKIDAAFAARSLFADVGEFHEKFGLPVAGKTRLGIIPHPLFKWRDSFIHEEHREFIDAHARGDLAGIADALADLVWVALGTAHYYGIPFDQVWAEVRRANLEKRPWVEGDPIKPRNATTVGEIVKPDGWRPPDVLGIIQRFAAKLRGR